MLVRIGERHRRDRQVRENRCARVMLFHSGTGKGNRRTAKLLKARPRGIWDVLFCLLALLQRDAGRIFGAARFIDGGEYELSIN